MNKMNKFQVLFFERDILFKSSSFHKDEMMSMHYIGWMSIIDSNEINYLFV